MVETIEITEEYNLKGLAEKIISAYPPPYCFALTGNLGAGKTTFVKYLLTEFKVSDLVTSPTYSIINVYGYKNKKVYHLDLYRLEEWEEAIHIGIEEILDSDHYVWIEWPEIIEHLLPDNTLHINFKVINGKRFIEYG